MPMPMPMPMPLAVQDESLMTMPSDESLTSDDESPLPLLMPMQGDESLTSDDDSPLPLLFPMPMPDESLTRRPTLPLLMDFRDQSWLDRFPLDRNIVFDYFALSPFYDRTCNNETLKMNSINPLDASRLSTMTGMEYQMTEVFENELFVFTRQRRDGPDSFTPIISYYVRDGTIYMGLPHSNAFPSRSPNSFIEHLKKRKKDEVAEETVFPCVLKILPYAIFSMKEPIVLGVEVIHGTAKVGTPICIPQKGFIDIGLIESMENKHRPACVANQGERVAIKIVGSNPDEEPKMFGTHFGSEDELASRLSGESIDNLTKYFRDDLSMGDRALIYLFEALVKT